MILSREKPTIAKTLTRRPFTGLAPKKNTVLNRMGA
jgi:hypothetical protein